MKKSLVILLTLVMMISSVFCLPVSALSANKVTETTIEYLENGDYIETVLTYEDSPTRATKSGSKTKNYKNSSGIVLWSVKVTGTFTYNGTTSSCTAVTHSTTCPGANWTIKSASSSRSGNTATAKATATLKAGSISQDYTMSVTLKCSASGTLS